MALSIVADDSAPLASLPGVTRTSRWSCDIYSGTADALTGNSLITREQLEPQKGRQPGVTAFLPNGEPCPPHLRAWREPGYMVIRQQDDGTFCVELTVSKVVQAWRRKADKAARHAARHEREQERINQDLVESGREYRNWQFRQGFDGSSETWEGTKAQLQAKGLGIGAKFPGEPGAPERLDCNCPLGFEFRVFQSHDDAKAAAGIYTAYSWYVGRSNDNKQFEPYTQGVLREVWTPDGGLSSNFYHGAATALVDAGLVPDIGLFPGQPSRNKMQASYRKDWTPMSNCNGQSWRITIRKKGNRGRYIVEVPVSEDEVGRRKQVREARQKEVKREEQVLSAQRKQLRQGIEPETTVEQFRSERTEAAELCLKLLWGQVFAKSDGALSFNIPEEGELSNELAEAFQTIRDAVQDAEILRDKKQVAAAQTRLKLVAARNDKGLQSTLQAAKLLRLVQPTADDGQG